MSNTKKIVPIGRYNGEQTRKAQKTNALIKLDYVESNLTFFEELFSGEIEGRKFAVNSGTNGTLFVTIEGVKGSIPKFEVSANDLVQEAYRIAIENELFEE